MLPTLPAFAIDLESLRGVIARLAISDDSAPSRAVLNSLLALAALHSSQTPRRATEYIAIALRSLRVSAQEGIKRHHSLQHIAAGILICAFEVRFNILLPEQHN